jgi:hypothetical protein
VDAPSSDERHCRAKPRFEAGSLKGRSVFAQRPLRASDAQRDKVAGLPCLVCGAERGVDPAHLAPRSLGGCDHSDCVAPLCRSCHRAYDSKALDLLPHLEPAWRAGLAHALGHLGLIGLLEHVTAERWRPEASADRVRPEERS